jgi:hypothetical protein
MNIKFLLLNLIVLTISCDQSQTKSPKQDNHKESPTHTTKRSERKSENHLNTKQTLDLLQGKWQHIDDKSNYLMFEGNYRKETAEGMTGWDEEEFSLSEKCLNESDKDNGIEKEEAKYISCLKSDLCWYIIGVDEENLMLSYMGRGNTLTYRRVK